MNTFRLPLALATSLVLGLASAAPAAIEVITNGGFESGATGWTSSNVLFTGSYDMSGNGNPAVLPHSGGGMAVLSGPSTSLDAELSQDVDFSDVVSASFSFWLQLEADDISLVLLSFLDTSLPESDFLEVYSGSDLVYSQGLDDLYALFGPGSGNSGNSTQTGWVQVSPTIDSSLFGTNPLTVRFNSVNASDPNGAQNFVAYVDDVSLMVVTPEPTTVIVWGGLGLIGLAASRRRSRR